jgi:hypothetical protein
MHEIPKPASARSVYRIAVVLRTHRQLYVSARIYLVEFYIT